MIFVFHCGNKFLVIDTDEYSVGLPYEFWGAGQGAIFEFPPTIGSTGMFMAP